MFIGGFKKKSQNWYFASFLRHLWCCVQFIIRYGWGDACVRSGLEGREGRNGENWRCWSKRWWRGYLKNYRLQPTLGPWQGLGKKPCRCKNPASFLGDIQGETFQITILFAAIHFKCKRVKEVASLVESPLASCHVVWLKVHVSIVGFSKEVASSGQVYLDAVGCIL